MFCLGHFHLHALACCSRICHDLQGSNSHRASASEPLHAGVFHHNEPVTVDGAYCLYSLIHEKVLAADKKLKIFYATLKYTRKVRIFISSCKTLVHVNNPVMRK